MNPDRMQPETSLSRASGPANRRMRKEKREVSSEVAENYYNMQCSIIIRFLAYLAIIVLNTCLKSV